MKKLMLFFILPVAIVFGAFYFHLLKQAELSTIAPELGIKNGKLFECPERPNCINSEFKGKKSSVLAIPITGNNFANADLKEKLKILIILNNGNLIDEGDNYLRFEFVTSKMHFVDDLELRIDNKQKVIHIRSASRVGYSDMGANLKRYEKIKAAIEQSL